jgi:hypothetical protein
MEKLNLTGKVFGRLTIITQGPRVGKKTSWKAKCSCGKDCIIRTGDLTKGDSKSCGCLRKDLLRIELKNQRFGKLIVVDYANKNGNSSSQFWKCKCDCGNEKNISGQHLREGLVKSCGCWFEKDEVTLLNEAKERFFNNIEKTESCWIWKGVIVRGGYGHTFFKKSVKAHRFSYMIHKGELEKEKMVCHKCDNPLCVNPEHLYLGTAKDNHNDMVNRGRFRPRGKTINMALKP